MASKRDKKNGGNVRADDCHERHSLVDTRVEKVERALFGTDGRGGIVSDISEIKSKLQIVTSILRTVVVPIVLPIMLALVGFWLGLGARI